MSSYWIAWPSIPTSLRTKHSKCFWKRPSQKCWFFKLHTSCQLNSIEAIEASAVQVFAPQSPLILRISTGALALLLGCWNTSAEPKGNLDSHSSFLIVISGTIRELAYMDIEHFSLLFAESGQRSWNLYKYHSVLWYPRCGCCIALGTCSYWFWLVSIGAGLGGSRG